MTSHPVSSQPVAANHGTGSEGHSGRSTPDSCYSGGQPQSRRLRQQRCCCMCKDSKGLVDTWNYPWDKSIPKCIPLCCMWYSFCLVFPCSLCIPRYRNLLCCVQEGCWDGTCCGACLFGLPPPGSKPRNHRGQMGSRVSHWSDSS